MLQHHQNQQQPEKKKHIKIQINSFEKKKKKKGVDLLFLWPKVPTNGVGLLYCYGHAFCARSFAPS